MRVFWSRLKFFRPLLLLLFIRFTAFAADSWGEAHGQSFVAIQSHGGLSLTIPYHAARQGSGKLIVEILDPEDRVLGRVEQIARTADGDGVWTQKIATTDPLSLEDLVWERVHYQFQYNGEAAVAFGETRSVSEILRRPVVHILGQSSYLAGSQGAIRVIVSDAANRPIAGNSTIRVDLLGPDQQSRGLFAGRLNQRGTSEAQFRLPAGVTGNFQLHYVVDTPLGLAESTQPVQLEDKVSILLTTEKPIYQPGQTIHLRALALNRADHRAAGSDRLTFEIKDSRGNKVFRKATETDAFGIASTEFTLADEVNLGMYQLRTLMGDPEAPVNTQQIAINVQRYVLPKFKVAIEFSTKDGKARRDYRPGDHITGTVRAHYFFGKPVDDAAVSIKASSMDIALTDAVSAGGRTDQDGTYHFDLLLPSYFTGLPLNNDAAPVVIEATAKDASGHIEVRGEPVTVSQAALLVTAIPEGGTLIPGLENEVFILTSYPDGSPARTTITAFPTDAPNSIPYVDLRLFPHERLATQSHAIVAGLRTDAAGVGAFRIKPSSGVQSLQIEADDGRGNRVSKVIQFQARDGAEQIMLHTDRAVYRAGDRIELRVFSTTKRGTAYIDIVRDGQTVLTRDLDIVDGRASLAIDATPDMSETLDINAYSFGQNAQAIGDHRLVFVQPAEELHIEATADASAYKPGAEAQVRLRVTNQHGDGVLAALGLQVVD
jgi:hypothetical protein